MGSAARTKARNTRERLAATRAVQRRAEKRRRLLLAGGSVAVVLALVGTLIAVKLSQSPAHYIGGQFCPFCAAERWALAAAVSRFGTLSGLSLIHSSPADTDPSTPTLSFEHTRYTSRYLAFVPVEWLGQAADPGTPFGHVYLQRPTAQQQALFARYGGGSIPFVDIGNRYFLPQVQYDPAALAGLSWTQVAAAMHDPSSPVARDIDGAANVITAAICTLTQGQPGGVCQSAGVRAAAAGS